ncbi:MAG: MBL fold metallo-hydrolase [Desulfobacteraceae bacterium]|nr:MAG: MBL fold metallo-hydrolase [Desulfobacteraceae bacterium]
MKKENKCENVGDGIYVIETYYLNRTEHTACYLVIDEGEAAVIETNTNHAIPFILGALEQLGRAKEQVKYVILTHVHLDHAGGAGGLMKELPGAKVILHPRGKKHMIEPEKLIRSVKEVYGADKYKEMYGEIFPIPKEKVITANDGDVFRLGGRDLQMFDLRGHAKHHLVVLDRKTGALFSGDNFGIGYPRMKFGNFRMVFASTSPTQFEPDQALATYAKIAGFNPSRVLLTHYGALDDIKGTHEQLKSWIEFSVAIAGKRYDQGYREKELDKILEQDIWDHFDGILKNARGTGITPEEKEWLALDSRLNAQGLAYYIHKLHTASSDAGQS